MIAIKNIIMHPSVLLMTIPTSITFAFIISYPSHHHHHFAEPRLPGFPCLRGTIDGETKRPIGVDPQSVSISG